MMRVPVFGSLFVLLLLPAITTAADAPAALATASGTVAKVDKDSLTIRPRGPSGQFEKDLKLKLTGTTKISTLAVQTRAGKTVVVQRDTDAKDLQPKQVIAVIYTTGSSGAVLLSAVVQPVGGK
jgi:hypothetical protein